MRVYLLQELFIDNTDMDFVVANSAYAVRFAFLRALMGRQCLRGLRCEPVAHIARIRDLVGTGEISLQRRKRNVFDFVNDFLLTILDNRNNGLLLQHKPGEFRVDFRQDFFTHCVFFLCNGVFQLLR